MFLGFFHLLGEDRLRLAGAYELSNLSSCIEACLCNVMDGVTALRLLKQLPSLVLPAVVEACEVHIAQDFSRFATHADFVHLTALQVAQILQREDLHVNREEAVLQGLVCWMNASKDDRKRDFGLLL